MSETTTTTISDFLLARIAEDEAVARKASHQKLAGPFFGNWREDSAHLQSTGLERADIAHIARWDPARVLADCEAKRQILDIHWMAKFTDVSIGIRDLDVCCICHGFVDVDGDMERMVNVQQPFPCSTIRALAAVYADHHDYRQEWRV